MVQDYFDSPVAYNPDADQLVAGASFQVYATTDTGLTTPLTPLDAVSGTPIANLRSSSIGVLPAFRLAGDPAQVILKSGTFTTLLTSKYGIFLEVVPDPAVFQAAVEAAEQVPTLVQEAIIAADIPAVIVEELADAGVAKFGDPGIPEVVAFENDEYARAWGGGSGLPRVFAGILRGGGWFAFRAGLNIGNRRLRNARSDQFLRGTVLGNRVAEDAVDLQGNVPLMTLRRWGARIGSGGVAALAAWPFQPKPTTVIRTVRKDGTGDFTTIGSAIAASTDGSPAKRYVIDIADGVYSENKLLRDSSYITLRGRHPSTTRIVGYLPPNATDTQVTDMSTVDLRGTECYLENLTVTVQNGRYAVHPELNGLNPDSVYGWDNCVFEHLGNDEIVAWRAANPGSVGGGFDRVATGGFAGGRCAIGEGTASGASLVGKNSLVKGPSTYFLHDNSAFTKPAYHRFERHRFVGSSIMILNPIGAGIAGLVEFLGCRFDAERLVFQDSDWKSTSLDQPASHYEIQARLAGCNPVGATFAGMRGRALRIESAATVAPSSIRVTGTAADAVMGAVRTRDGGGGLKGYAWGYKDISGINGGSSGTTQLVNTLGRLLGDCSVTPKTLTVAIDGGTPVDIVFSTDLTAVTNASILATINAAMGGLAAATEYGVDQGETYPVSDRESMLLNDGTTGIPRWGAVKWGGNRRSARLVETADPASAFVGVALDPIAPGAHGRVLHRGKLFAAAGVEGQIPGVSALTSGDVVSLSGVTAGRFVVGSGKPVGVASDTNMFAFTGSE